MKHSYLVAANVTKSLPLNEQAAQKSGVERFNLNHLRFKLRNRISLNSEKVLQLLRT